MTDGILLAETQGDPTLDQYDTLIIDEAHERSLNIDFLLGYLEDAAAEAAGPEGDHHLGDDRRRALSKHFHDAPVIEVSGRLFPVEVRYRPVETRGRARGRARPLRRGRWSMPATSCTAGAGRRAGVPAGRARDPRRGEALRKHHPPHTEILPLFARLSAEEQSRIFKPHGGGASCWRPTSPKPR